MVMSYLRKAISLLRQWQNCFKNKGAASQFLLTTSTLKFLDEYDNQVTLQYSPPFRKSEHLKFSDDDKNITEVLHPDQWWGDKDMSVLKCPVCEEIYHHLGEPVKESGKDGYEASWGGRGDLVIIPIEGECGCLWEICFGFHKGNIAAFTRVNKSCESGEEG